MTLTDAQLLAPQRRDSTPMYLQIAGKIRHLIEAQHWSVDQALPSERQLVQSLGISRVTARKAVQQLSNWGVVVRRQGSGTYVTPRIAQPLSRLSSFSEEMSLRGFESRSVWLLRETAFATPVEMMHLGIRSDAMVSRLNRVRMANGVAIAIEYCRIPASILPDPTLIESSLYLFLDTQGTPVVRALQKINAVNAGQEQAKLLQIEPGSAMLFTTRVGYGRDQLPIELTHSYCRPDYYEFAAELNRRPA